MDDLLWQSEEGGASLVCCLSLMFPHVGHADVARGGGVLEFLLCPQSRPALDE